MKSTLVPGVERVERTTVDKERSITFLGDDMRIYSTPSMVNDMEYACYRLIQAHLDTGESSVGVHVAADHLGATPVGEEVEIRARVTGIEGRKVFLEIEVDDAAEIVGRGQHTRFIIDVARHGKRLQRKINALERRRA